MNTGACKQEMEISCQLKCNKQSLVNCGGCVTRKQWKTSPQVGGLWSLMTPVKVWVVSAFIEHGTFVIKSLKMAHKNNDIKSVTKWPTRISMWRPEKTLQMKPQSGQWTSWCKPVSVSLCAQLTTADYKTRYSCWQNCIQMENCRCLKSTFDKGLLYN
jgi:hypothetical protein